ncbi:protein phosphatase 1 regulatory subunit 35, partial [Pangshura tecta]
MGPESLEPPGSGPRSRAAMWVQGVLVVLLSGLAAPGRVQPPRCRVGERLPVPGPGGALAQPPRSRCPCVPLRWVRLAAAGAGLALGLLWIRCRRAPVPAVAPEAALLRDVSVLLRFIRAQLRQLARTERGDAPRPPPGVMDAAIFSKGSQWLPPSWIENEVGGGAEPQPRPHPARLPQPSGGRARLAAPGDDVVPAAGPPPAPLRPGAPPPRALPALDLSLSPARAGGGILRRRAAGGRAGRRQVRFLLGSPGPPHPAGPGLAEATTGLRGAAGTWPPPSCTPAWPWARRAAAAQQGFDARQAAQELLGTSFLARCSVEGKAAAGMNVPREQQLYQGLVSLQVPAEEVLSCALQGKLSLVRSLPEPRSGVSPPLPGACPRRPDPRMFYESRELFAETPYLGVEGPPPLRLQPHVRPPASTFSCSASSGSGRPSGAGSPKETGSLGGSHP